MKNVKISQAELKDLQKMNAEKIFNQYDEWLEFPIERLDHIEKTEHSVMVIDRGINEGAYLCDGSTEFHA